MRALSSGCHSLLPQSRASSEPSNLPSTSFSSRSDTKSFFSSLKLRRTSAYRSRTWSCLRSEIKYRRSSAGARYFAMRTSRGASNSFGLIMVWLGRVTDQGGKQASCKRFQLRSDQMCSMNNVHFDLPHRRKTTALGSLGAYTERFRSLGEPCLTRRCGRQLFPLLRRHGFSWLGDQIAFHSPCARQQSPSPDGQTPPEEVSPYGCVHKGGPDWA